MKQLGVAEGELCSVATAYFPKASSAKFQPHSSKFLDISDHYMLLMRTLEHFAALTAGTTVRVTDGRQVYNLDVLEVGAKQLAAGQRDDSRGKAVDLSYTEISLDFESPKDQQKPPRLGATAAASSAVAAEAKEEMPKDEQKPPRLRAKGE